MKPDAPRTALAAGQLLGAPVPANSMGHARLRVMAYDIGEPRRAARVRRLLHPWAAGDGQYSVCELHLGAADLNGLLDAVHTRIDAAQDRLAMWQPARQLAWRLAAECDVGAQGRWPAYRTWVLAYDIGEPERLQWIQRCVAAQCVAVQRSVYVLHGPQEEARGLVRRAATCLRDADRLSVWPLQSPAHLWTTQPMAPACLPLGHVSGSTWLIKPGYRTNLESEGEHE